MTGNPMVDLALVTLGPLILWGVFWTTTRTMVDAEALILHALCSAPGETLPEAQLQRSTGLSEQELAITLNRLQDRVHCANGRVTLRECHDSKQAAPLLRGCASESWLAHSIS